MLDISAIESMVEEQIKATVDDQIQKVLSSDEWLLSFEQKVINYAQERILLKFSSSSIVPELVESIKTSVAELFSQGQIPGIDQYVDHSDIKQTIDIATERLINTSILELIQDSAWLEKIERMINQTVVQRTVSKIASTDINTVIRDRVDENLTTVHKKLMQNFSSNGISDQSTALQLTVTDNNTVIENQLVAKDLQIMGTTCVNDLTVTGSINTDNRSWQQLAKEIGRQALDQIDANWQDRLVKQVTEQITQQGIDFDQVKIQGNLLVSGNTLSSAITETNIQKIGQLHDLRVKGEAHIHNTVSIINRRLGINTITPESALSIWDEEVAVIIGKHQAKQAYIGTSRDQSLVLGVNRQSQIEIDTTGLTRIKKLQVGLHKISHDSQVPGWAGTRGDLVFNSNPGPDRVFAWVCLGSHKWQTLKSAE